MLSRKAIMLKPSPTLAMAQRARDLIAKGNDVISLTVGEPDWQTFPAANEAAIQAIQNGFTKYTPVNGIPELRKAIADQIQNQLNTSYTPEQVCVGSGAKFIIFSALQMLLDPDDEVIIPSPYWVSYPVMVELSSGKSVIAECGEKENFKLTAQILEKHITSKTKILILCSPSNPTGLMYSKTELQELANVLRKYPQVFVISDDIYNRLVFSGGIAPHLLSVAPDLKDRLLIVNGASKSYAMTGWRVGWSLGPIKLIKAMTDYMSQSTSNCSSISQKAALAAILNCEGDILKANQILLEKRDWFFKEMKKISFFHPFLPDGAFYFWVKIADGKSDSKKIADTLLDQYHLATVPGIEFGAEGYLRMSFATTKSNLEKALDRLEKFSKNN